MKFFQTITLLIFLFLLNSCGSDLSHKPILILASENNFGFYSAELLKTEGLNEFIMEPLINDRMTLEHLKEFDIVIITEAAITPDMKNVMARYIEEGGNMIFFRPDKTLSHILGINDAGESLSEGYIGIDTASGIGKGLIREQIQFHGAADGYHLNGALKIASLYSGDETDTGFPAVTYYAYGRGKTVCFMFNLPKSVVYMHQGNPGWKGQERDGVPGLRNLDLFVGAGSEKNWIDKNKVHLPQADEQIRLLTHSIEQLNSGKRPLPRLWYFPGLNKCLALLTCDGENNGDPGFYESEINTELNLVKSKGGHMTLYLIGTGIKRNVVENWRMQGHEVSIHYDNTRNAAHPTRENMDSVISIMQEQFRAAYRPEIPLTTVRNHWITWYGWAEQAIIELEHGIHLDCNSYKYDNSKDAARPGWIGGPGYFTGSGIPMKFADVNGKVLDIYQSETQIVDEQLNTKGGIFNGFKILVDRSLHEEKYAVVNAVFHPNSNSNKPYMEDLEQAAAYCQSMGVPMWTAGELLDFLQARDSTEFADISWSDDELSFTLHAPIKNGKEFTFFVPYRFENKIIAEVCIGDKKVNYTVRELKDYEYAFVPINSSFVYQVKVKYGR